MSLELTSFSYFDIITNIDDMSPPNNMAFDVGFEASSTPIDNATKLIETWEQHKDILDDLPFVGGSKDILDGVGFLQNIVDNNTNTPIIDTLINGAAIRLSIKLAIIDATQGLLDCEGFRMSLNIGSDALSHGIFTGIDYRMTGDAYVNTIKYGTDWMSDAAKAG
eukprot:337447_1